MQALHAQYQQAAASGLHTTGLDSQQINPALTPFMMMSPMFAASGIPPTSMAVLSHINQVHKMLCSTVLLVIPVLSS